MSKNGAKHKGSWRSKIWTTIYIFGLFISEWVDSIFRLDIYGEV